MCSDRSNRLSSFDFRRSPRSESFQRSAVASSTWQVGRGTQGKPHHFLEEAMITLRKIYRYGSHGDKRAKWVACIDGQVVAEALTKRDAIRWTCQAELLRRRKQTQEPQSETTQ